MIDAQGLCFLKKRAWIAPHLFHWKAELSLDVSVRN